MEQFNVYSRVTLSRDSAEAHLSRLKAHLPSTGVVTAITLTEKQYENRKVLMDTRPHKDLTDPGAQMTLVI